MGQSHPKTKAPLDQAVPRMDISKAGVFVHASFVEKFGLPAGALLSQISYWFYKASDGKSYWMVERFGHRWLAHTREQFSQETGMSLSTIRGAIERLQKCGAIVVEQHLFGGKNVSYIRFGPGGHNQVGEADPAE